MNILTQNVRNFLKSEKISGYFYCTFIHKNW